MRRVPSGMKRPPRSVPSVRCHQGLVRGLALCAGLAAPLAVASDAHAVPQVHQNVDISRVYYRYVYVPAGATYTWETTNLTSGADTVLHLWRWGIGEVGYDDDGGAGVASQVSYTNNTGSQQSLILIARSYSSSSTGSARLLQNGSTLVSTIPVAGQRLSVENGAGYVHETVQAPGGDTAPFMMALNSSRHLVDLDFTSGVGLQAAVEHPSTFYVVVGTPNNGTGRVHVYSNDPADADGDGLGTGLEAELGTCDNTTAPGCTNVHDAADTDRDGLPDGIEVFGVDGSNPQHLPAWGADPLHKDVFVELDYHNNFSSNPFTESDAVAAAAIFAAGEAVDLNNPDGEDGVRLHIDAGSTPTNASNETLIGNWGGSNSVPNTVAYGSAPDTYRNSARAGIFHYGLMTSGGGGGQGWAPGDRFTWGVTTWNRYVGSFVHELGHNLNLHHYGHSAWGQANGKPNYLSLMNYAFGGSAFSTGESSVVLNPALVDESAGIGADASHLQGGTFQRLVGPSEEVDWDFDGLFTGGGFAQLKAPVSYATWSGTYAFGQNEESMHNESDLPATTPTIIRGPGGRMYTFYVDDDRIVYRHAMLDGDQFEGSCPGGDEIGDDCVNWSGAVTVPTSANARGLTAVYADGQVLLAFRTQWDSLRTIRATGANTSGSLTGWTGERYHSATTDKEPEAELMRVDPAQFGGESLVVALMYRDKSTGQYRWRTLADATSTSSTYRGALLTDTGGTLTGTESPTFAAWPYNPSTTSNGTTCGAITDTLGDVGLYCYDRATNRFEDVSASAFPGTQPRTVGKPGLAYHAYRSLFGIPRAGDPTRGAYWLSVVQAGAVYDFVDMWISDPISTDPAEALGDVFFPSSRRGKVGNVWTNLLDGSGMAMYDDEDLGAMKAVWIRQDGGDTSSPLGDVHLRFLPFADGGFRAEFRDGNDFQVMERGICLGISNGADCGPSSFGLD